MKSHIAKELLELADDLKADSKEVQPFRTDTEGFATVTFRVKGDGLHSLLKILKQCEVMGDQGHSFGIIVDPQGGKDYKRERGFDGDGADRVKDIMVNGEPLTEKFEW